MNYTFTNPGKYVDVEIECFTQDDNLHIVQSNVEHESRRTYEVGRICINAAEFFNIYNALAESRDNKFDTAAQYATMLLNMFGNITLQSARDLWRIATYQVDNFLILTGNKTIAFRVLATESPEEQLRLEESFGDSVIASCRYRKVTVKRRGFK